MLGLVEQSDPPRLSALGATYFQAKFVRGDEEAAVANLRDALLTLPPVIAVAQLLDGVAGRTRASIETVLRSQGFGNGLKDRDVGFFVALLARAGIIRYTKATGAVQVLVHPARAEDTPPSVFISPSTPFGNRVWLRRVLEEARGDLRWLDKHFTSAAFEPLWEAVDGNNVSRVRILSLYLTDAHAGRKVKRDYDNLKTEFASRGVVLEWRAIDSRLIRDTHDRWVLGDATARNIPNVNAILSGQHSELNQSQQNEELARLFEGYWTQAQPIEDVWGGNSS